MLRIGKPMRLILAFVVVVVVISCYVAVGPTCAQPGLEARNASTPASQVQSEVDGEAAFAAAGELESDPHAADASPQTGSSDVEKAPQPKGDTDEISRWITDLDSDLYLERERATQSLIAAGPAAFDALLVAINSKPPEPAERALWVLRSQSRAGDSELAVKALEYLVRVEGRPKLVETARADLVLRRVAACRQRLVSLGANVIYQLEAVDTANNIANVLHVSLGEGWTGTPQDLAKVAELDDQFYFRLEGKDITDEVVSSFEAKERLAFLQLFNTRVTPAAVDAIKLKHPGAIVYVKNKALLGVQAEKHPAGVMVLRVEERTGAANAGIVANDIITAIDGHKLADFDRMTAWIGQYKPGDIIKIEILRNNQPLTLSATLGARID